MLQYLGSKDEHVGELLNLFLVILKKKTVSFVISSYILTDFNYATLTSPYIFQKTFKCKLPLLR